MLQNSPIIELELPTDGVDNRNGAFGMLRFCIQNLLAVYAWGFQLFVKTGIVHPLHEGRAIPGLAVIIFVISISEGFFVIFKTQNALHRSRKRLSANQIVWYFFGALIFRLFVGLITSFVTGSLMSPTLSDGSTPALIAGAMIVILVAKELIVLFAVLIILLKGRGRPFNEWCELIGDVLFLTFGCIVFSIFTYPGIFFHPGLADGWLLPLIFLTSIFVLLSTRLGIFVEDVLNAETFYQLFSPCITLVLTALAATYSFYD